MTIGVGITKEFCFYHSIIRSFEIDSKFKIQNYVEPNRSAVERLPACAGMTETPPPCVSLSRKKEANMEELRKEILFQSAKSLFHFA